MKKTKQVPAFLCHPGLTFASGAAAITTVTHLLSTGDHVVSMYDLYGGTNTYFRTIATRYVALAPSLLPSSLPSLPSHCLILFPSHVPSPCIHLLSPCPSPLQSPPPSILFTLSSSSTPIPLAPHPHPHTPPAALHTHTRTHFQNGYPD